MSEPGPVSCPVCGGASRQLAAVFSELMARRERARQGAAEAQAAQPPPGRPTRAGTGEGALPTEELLVGVAVGIVGAVLRQAAKPLGRRAGRAANAALARGEAAMETARASVNRHPELYCCQRDEIVHEAGTRSTVPLAAAMRLLIRGNDAALITALGRGS
jgi:hypothetical protein